MPQKLLFSKKIVSCSMEQIVLLCQEVVHLKAREEEYTREKSQRERAIECSGGLLLAGDEARMRLGHCMIKRMDVQRRLIVKTYLLDLVFSVPMYSYIAACNAIDV